MMKVFKLLMTTQADERVIMTNDYLGASAECLMLAIAVSAAITYVFNPEQFEANPIKTMVGYNNPCVAWDAPPALYVAALIFTPTVYYGIRYAIFDSNRARMSTKLSPVMKHAILVINTMYGFSQAVNMGIFVITPEGSVTKMMAHSACFLQLVPILGIATSMNYFEEWTDLRLVQKVVCILWVISWVLETVFAATGIFLYKGDGVHVHEPMVMQAVDYFWFAMLPFQGFFMPKGDAILCKFELQAVVPAEEKAALKSGP